MRHNLFQKLDELLRSGPTTPGHIQSVIESVGARIKYYDTDERQALRQQALELANRWPFGVVGRATDYYEFLQGE